MFNIAKYRTTSSYTNSSTPKKEPDLIIEQAIREFDLYQRYMPNTHNVYINYSTTSILATMQDITDLEMRTDTKYMLTSLKNKVNLGDIIKWDDLLYLCIYDKVKTTANCLKIKIQPCNVNLKFIAFENDNPIIRQEPIITNVYYTDVRDEKVPIPWNSDMYGISIQYNKYTQQLKKLDRIFLYETPWEIVGIDYTNINYQNDKGFYRYMIRPVDIIPEFDNKEEKIANYYKYFPKIVESPIEIPVEQILNLTSPKTTIKRYETINILSSLDTTNYNFVFVDDESLGCQIKNITSTGFDLVSGSQFGVIEINALSITDNKVCASVVVRIGQ